MSYPGYPGYPPQGPGQQASQPGLPNYQNNMNYPLHVESAAPQSPYGFSSSPYPATPGFPQPSASQPAPYPNASLPGTCPYPGQASPYPSGNVVSSGYPNAHAPSTGPYPNASIPSPYPGSLPSNIPYTGSSIPTASQYPQSSPYPSGNASPYPSAQYPGGSAMTSGGVPSSSYPSHPSMYPGTTAPTGNYSTCAAQANIGSCRATSAVPSYPTNTHASQSSSLRAPTPTLRAAQPFNPRSDAEILRKAMKGFGTDEKAIIQVLTKRTNAQRQQIAMEFKTLYGKDLVSDLKSETSGKFEDVLVALMTPLPEFLAKELNHAIRGIGTNEETVVEILCTSNNYEIKCIKAAYEKLFGTSLEHDLAGDTSGSFRRLLVSLCQANRSEVFGVDQNQAFQDAQALMRAGELRLGTDESTFNAVLCSRSYSQLAATFIEYQRLTGNDFENALRSEFSGDIESGLVAIVKTVRDKSSFFAERLHASMAGAGTHDRALIRIMVSRCEIDLGDIRSAYQRIYGRTLEQDIADDTSGDYKKTLLGLLC